MKEYFYQTVFRFNYHLEKVRDIVNNAFTTLLTIDEASALPSMAVDEYSEKKEYVLDTVEPRDRLMCEIVDEIPI